MKARILIFAKAPVPGRVKTRLIPALGAEGAAALARDMLARTVEEALASGLEAELVGDPDPAAWYEGPALRLSAQGDGDLGARLARAVRRCLADGARPVLIGSDCPALDRRRLAAAAAALETHEAVLHPAEDGGYVLLGLARFDRLLFERIPWSSASVAAETIARIRRLGWSLHLGETLRDVDEPEDLAPLHRHPRAGFPLSRE
jgi:uncharacterized protein